VVSVFFIITLIEFAVLSIANIEHEDREAAMQNCQLFRAGNVTAPKHLKLACALTGFLTVESNNVPVILVHFDDSVTILASVVAVTATFATVTFLVPHFFLRHGLVTERFGTMTEILVAVFLFVCAILGVFYGVRVLYERLYILHLAGATAYGGADREFLPIELFVAGFFGPWIFLVVLAAVSGTIPLCAAKLFARHALHNNPWWKAGIIGVYKYHFIKGGTRLEFDKFCGQGLHSLPVSDASWEWILERNMDGGKWNAQPDEGWNRVETVSISSFVAFLITLEANPTLWARFVEEMKRVSKQDPSTR
jgi:hypothetical protein